MNTQPIRDVHHMYTRDALVELVEEYEARLVEAERVLDQVCAALNVLLNAPAITDEEVQGCRVAFDEGQAFLDREEE